MPELRTRTTSWPHRNGPMRSVGWGIITCGDARCVAFSPEGRYAAVGLENGTIALLRLAQTGEVVTVPGHRPK